jgi:hypothetical protein
MKKATLMSVGVLAIIGIAALSLSGVSVIESGDPSAADASDAIGQPATGPLDGMTFKGHLGPSGAPADVADQWVFEDGMFVSKECERRCNYPPRPYYSREAGESTEFISVTNCPDKNATIVWRGTVDGRSIKGEATWTMERWYWTIENTFAFEGELAAGLQPVASD